MNRKALGKGIHAIIPEETQESLAAEARPILLAEVRPNPYQPREHVESDLDELVQSIRDKGVLQPVVVRRRRDGYELVMGGRRCEAARRAGLDRIPAVVRTVDDGEMLELALVENLQRRNLNPVEEALGYRQMQEKFGRTQDDIAGRVGKDRSTVANALRLLELPEKVREHLKAGQITAGHGRALLLTKNRRLQVTVCDRIMKEDLSVRAVERLLSPRPKPPGRRVVEKDPHLRALEETMQEYLGSRVTIGELRNGAGIVTVVYHSIEDLDRLLRRMRGLA